MNALLALFVRPQNVRIECILPRLDPSGIVFLGCEYGVMTEEHRNVFDICAVLQQIDGERVAEGVRGCVLDACCLEDLVEPLTPELHNALQTIRTRAKEIFSLLDLHAPE